MPFALPTLTDGTAGCATLDTIEPYVEERRYTGGDDSIALQGRTLAVFVLRSEQRRRVPDPSATQAPVKAAEIGS